MEKKSLVSTLSEAMVGKLLSNTPVSIPSSFGLREGLVNLR
jgi:hypothetical protein